MYKQLLAFILIALLSSCAFVHKMDVEQGNIFNEDMVHRLHRGMTKDQVKDIMGTPTLINTFDENRINYVYTFRPGGGRMIEKKVTLIFSRGVLKEIIDEDVCGCNR